MFYRTVALFGLGFPLGIIFSIFLVLLAILVFEIAMVVSVIRNRSMSDTRQILWIVGMLFIHPVVAIVYYFTDYNNR
jgi:hypothetical protein